MSFTRDTILNSMEVHIKMTRSHMGAQPQRLTEAAECMEEVRAIHETLMIFDIQFTPDLIAYLNMVD
jgi:RecA/RadA recombinase